MVLMPKSDFLTVFARHYVVDEDTKTVPVGYNNMEVKRSGGCCTGTVQIEKRTLILGMVVMAYMGVELIRRWL